MTLSVATSSGPLRLMRAGVGLGPLKTVDSETSVPLGEDDETLAVSAPAASRVSDTVLNSPRAVSELPRRSISGSPDVPASVAPNTWRPVWVVIALSDARRKPPARVNWVPPGRPLPSVRSVLNVDVDVVTVVVPDGLVPVPVNVDVPSAVSGLFTSVTSGAVPALVSGVCPDRLMKFTVVISLSDASSSGPIRDTDPLPDTLKNPPNVVTGTGVGVEVDVARATRGLAASRMRGSVPVLTTL